MWEIRATLDPNGETLMIASKNNGKAISRPNIGLFRLSLIAIFVGVVTGFGALGFRGLIGFIHNLSSWDAFHIFTMPMPILR